MTTEDKEILCSLIRDHEDHVGSSRVTEDGIKDKAAIETFIADSAAFKPLRY